MGPLMCIGAHLPVVVDDSFGVSLAETIPSAYTCVDTVSRMCGFELEKATNPRRPIDMIGDTVSFKQDSVTAELPLSRRGDLIRTSDEVLKSGRLTPAVAAEIRGRLRFSRMCMAFE